MEWAIVLPLVAFALLAVLFALFLRRAGRLIAATRDVERFRRQIARPRRAQRDVAGRDLRPRRFRPTRPGRGAGGRR